MKSPARLYDDLLYTLDYKYDLDRITMWICGLAILISLASIVVSVWFG